MTESTETKPAVDRRRGMDAAVGAIAIAAERFNVTGLGVRVAARNSSGDRYDTDGELAVIVLSRGGERVVSPVVHPDPPRVALKNRVWYAVHRDREAPARSSGGDEGSERRA